MQRIRRSGRFHRWSWAVGGYCAAITLAGCEQPYHEAALIEPTRRPAIAPIAQTQPAHGHPMFLDPMAPAASDSDLAAVEVVSPQ